MLKKYIFIGLLLFFVVPFSITAQQPAITMTRIATNLQNPRGVAILPDGRLLVAEVGMGLVTGNSADNTGKLSVFEDVNLDGDYDDVGERTPIFEQLPGYNILYQFNPGRDEVVGIGDVLVLEDGRIYFTLDDNFEVLSIVEVSPEFERLGNLIVRDGTLNSIAYDVGNQVIYVAESTVNAVTTINLDGEVLNTVYFNLLASNQQPVPSGVAVDPTTGELLVTLFSGQLWDYYDEILSFMPGDSKVVRVDPETGTISDEITGLTTAVDVAVDEIGNVFVVELTTEWPAPTMSTQFDVFDPNSPPDAGGYARFSGQVTMYPVSGAEPIILADDLDQPTNITYHENRLYVSVGQGTPGRSIWVDGTLTTIVGEIFMISVPNTQ